MLFAFVGSRPWILGKSTRRLSLIRASDSCDYIGGDLGPGTMGVSENAHHDMEAEKDAAGLSALCHHRRQGKKGRRGKSRIFSTA